MHLKESCTRWILVAVLILAVNNAAFALSPDEVYTKLYSAIRLALGFHDDAPQSNFWVSISIVGSLADPKDPASVNDIANFAPLIEPTLISTTRVPTLDALYENIINGQIGPDFTPSATYKAAQDVLYTDVLKQIATPEYQAYLDLESKVATATAALIAAKTPTEINAANLLLKTARQNFNTAGFVTRIASALNTITATNAGSLAVKDLRRRNILQVYRDASAVKYPSNGADLAFTSPVSEVSPKPEDWPNQTGWTQVSCASSSTSTFTSFEKKVMGGSGGFSLGFITFGGSASSTTVNQNKVTNIRNLSYSFKLLKVPIRRVWLDSSIFIEPTRWAWRNPNVKTSDYPASAMGADKDGFPQAAKVDSYDGQNIFIPLLPMSLVLAKEVEISATVSNTDFVKFQNSHGGGGGVALFGVIGGVGKSDYTLETTSQTGTDTSFVIKSDGISVIGVISQIIAKQPDPNKQFTWTNDAWLPN